MATTRVQLPDGNIGEFPATMKPEDIQTVLSKQFPPPPPPETTGQKAIGMGKDLGKGVLESVGGALDTIGSPVSWAAHKMGIANQTPEQEQQQANLFKPANNTQAVGAGLGDALQAMVPVEKSIPLVKGAAKAVGEFAEPLVNKVSEFNQAWNPLPLKSRAVNAFKTIENAAKDVPVELNQTQPAVGDFRDYVNTGGRGSQVVNKLGRRIDKIPEQGPINFPEARDFYSNVSTASAKPGFLRRAIEAPTLPKQRFNLGNVKGAMNSDLTNAAETIGRGEDYTNAMKEYANSAKLRKLGLIGAGVAGTELARRSGLLGKIIPKVLGE